MSVKAYIGTQLTVIGSVLLTNLEPNLKILTIVIVTVISVIANLLYIGGKFRNAITKAIMQDVREEIIRLDYDKYLPTPSKGKK
jgi:formaldehyde-activating enzyme involved in methanogenesis